jgi:hypothetical protein
MLAPSAAIFSLLLIITGAAKVARPQEVERALTTLGFPRIPGAGTLIGLLEIAVGAAALVFPGALTLQAALYLAFAVWIALALRASVPMATCGCLGREDTPPTMTHLVLDVVAAAISLGAAMSAPLQLTADLAGLATVTVIAVGVFLCYVILTDGARLSGARAR